MASQRTCSWALVGTPTLQAGGLHFPGPLALRMWTLRPGKQRGCEVPFSLFLLGVIDLPKNPRRGFWEKEPGSEASF